MDMPPFEDLVHMANNNPEALEELRHALIEDTIAQAPEHYHRRLRGLQFQIDMERRKASNPMSACVRISQMMHDHLLKLKDALHMDWIDEDLEDSLTGQATGTGSVIPFPIREPIA